MAGTAPESADVHGVRYGPPGRRYGARRRGRWGWWVVLLLVVGVLVLALSRPWPSLTPPDPASPTPPGTTSSGPTPSASAVPPPGAGAVFDAATASTLFATAADLERAVPGATAGVSRGLEPGTRPWGLPPGAVVEPASCTAAVTVVSAPPAHHDATSWVTNDLTFEQDVVVLLDAAAARAAFRALVTTLDECPRYAQVVPGSDGPRWTAEPALEGQGVFPAIVHDLTAEVEGDTYQQTSGHLLVGNAILTWTATALGAPDREEARAVLGSPDDLSSMAETRALAAVRGLS